MRLYTFPEAGCCLIAGMGFIVMIGVTSTQFANLLQLCILQLSCAYLLQRCIYRFILRYILQSLSLSLLIWFIKRGFIGKVLVDLREGEPSCIFCVLLLLLSTALSMSAAPVLMSAPPSLSTTVGVLAVDIH